MEGQRNFNKAGRFLTADDICRLDRLIFMPAVVECDRQGLCDTDEGSYYKNLVEPSMIIDSVEYYPRFYSEMDQTTGACTHYVAQDALQNYTFSQLSTEEREQLRMLFQRQYVEEGGELAIIADDELWAALHNEEQYGDVEVSYIETTQYIFSDRSAKRNYDIAHRLQLKNEPIMEIGCHDLISPSLTDMPPIKPAGKTDAYTPEELAVLDMMYEVYEDISTLTTTDLKDVCNIMTSLGLITWKDQKRFLSDSYA